jgi:hypothetical protein
MKSWFRLFTIVCCLSLCLAPSAGPVQAGRAAPPPTPAAPLSGNSPLPAAPTWELDTHGRFGKYLAWADADGDSDLDVMVADYWGGCWLYLNDGRGGFSRTGQLQGWPSSIAWGDVDGDGDLDLAADGGDSSWPSHLYLNDGQGGLSLGWTAPVSVHTNSVAWGDADGDGDLDLALGNFYEANQLYLNDGSGQLSLGWTAPVWGYTNSVAWGDVDGDGDLDLAVGNFYEANQLYLNDGSGQLSLSPWAPNWNYTIILAWGDVDGDGDLDLAVGNQDSPNQLYLNNGVGNLTLSSWAPAERDTQSVAWGDADNDGDLDLAVGNGGYHNENDGLQANQLYLNDGSGGLSDSGWAPLAGHTRSVAWGDVDGDGDLDLAAAGRDLATQIYQNTAASGLSLSAWSPPSGLTFGLAWGDADSDGDLDLAVGKQNAPNQLYLNDGYGNLSLSSWSPGAMNTINMAWGDVDGNGDLDLAVANTVGEPNQLYLNDGHGNLTLSSWAPPADHTTFVAWGDADGDGDLDLAVANSKLERNRPIQLYRNVNGMLENTPYWTASLTGYTGHLAWGDVDNDGDLDLAVISWDGLNHLYLNDGAGNLTLSEWQPALRLSRSVAWGDVDSDGDLDLAVGNFGEPNQLFLNDGRGHLSLSDWRPLSRVTTSVAWGDYEGDGDLDLAVANFGTPNQLYLNDGAGNLNLSPWAPASHNSEFVAWGDVDGDGDLDLAFGNSNEQNQLYLNPSAPAQMLHRTGRGALGLSSLTSPANYYATSHIWEGAAPFTYTLSSPEGAAQTVLAFYTPDGGGNWRPAVAASGTQTENLSTVMGYAVSFDGSDDHIDLPDMATDYTGGITVGAWVYCHSLQNWFRVLDLGNGAPSDNILFSNVGTSADLRFAIFQGSTLYSLTAPGVLETNRWLHLAATVDASGNAKLYKNGVQVASGNMSLPNLVNRTNNYLGRSNWAPDAYFDGLLDEVRLYNRALSAAEVARLANSEEPATTGLVAYWPLNEGRGTVADDQSGNGNIGTLVNGPHWALGAPDRSRRVFNWDALASGFFGQSDNVVLRLVARPDCHPTPNGIPGPYLYPFMSATSFPVRVRGSQVWVRNETGSPVGGALVYRLPQGQAPGSPYADLSGQPYQTTSQGYLPGSGTLALGDQLVALWPTPNVVTMTLPGNGNLGFDGRNDYIDLPDMATDYTNGITVGAWVYYHSLQNASKVIDLGNGSPADNILLTHYSVSADLRFEVFKGTGSNYYLSAQGVLETNRWLHLVASVDASGNATLYKNGVPVASGTLPLPNSVNRTSNYIGRSNFATDAFFDGQLSEVRLYNRALSAAEVALLYAGTAPSDTGLVGYWPLNEGSGTLAYDQSGNGHTGTIYGATWASASKTLATLYHTSAAPTPTGLAADTVTAPGVQILTVSADNPLVLFNLDVALEWDARGDQLYLDALEDNFQRTSEVLYDWTNGQAALGQVTIYHDRQHWDEADVRIYATNRLRPNANQGGFTLEAITETITSTGAVIAYSPGQVRMGAVWNRYGDPGSNLGDDWPRALAHELGHYLFYLDDNYLGLDAAGQVIPVTGCPSAMSDPYSQSSAYDEFHPDAGWMAECENTLSNRVTGRSDWATIARFYAGLGYPEGGNLGPTNLPLAVTQVSFVAPPQGSSALLDPTFYLTEPPEPPYYGAPYFPGNSARAYLFQTVAGEDRLVDLGSPVLDHVLARGARLGDQLCVFEPAADRLGCETLSANDNDLALRSDPAWQPEITVTPVSSRTLAVMVTAPPSLTLQTRLFPLSGVPTLTTTLSLAGAVYSGVLSAAEPALSGYVQVWVAEDWPCAEAELCRQAVTAYALGGSPGPHGAGSGSGSNAPAVSADGQVILYGDVDFPVDEFYTLQELNRFPTPLAWATPVGAAYRLSASAGAPPLAGASLSLAYMAMDVPAGEEAWIRAYFWDGVAWQILPTTLDTYQNTATVPVRGEGVYALMSSYQIRLYPGWNNVSYPVYGTRPVTDSLASIAGYYGQVYYYDPTDGLDHWKLYDPGVPGWVNDLSALSFGRGYWISVTQNITTTNGITLYLKGTAAGGQVLLPAAFNAPPATFYGRLNAGPAQAVTAWIGDTACGQGLTRQVGGQAGYVVDVVSAFQSPGCGAPGRAVSFMVGEARLPWLGQWTDARPVHLDFWDLFQMFLPLVLRW